MLKAISMARDSHRRNPSLGSDVGTSKAHISKTRASANDEQAVTLGIHNHPPEVFSEIDQGSKRILAILANRSWALAPNATQGATWIELVVLFFLHGGTLHDLGLVGKDGAAPASSMKHVLTACKL